MGKRILEGTTEASRAKKRQNLGTLRQLTVQPSTRKRYDKALDTFFDFLRQNHLTIPKSRDRLDGVVCDYLEHLWSQGFGRALASDSVAALQDSDPKLKGHLPGAWRLLKTWSVNEIPNRAPPLPQHIVHAMCGWAAFNGYYAFAVSLLVGFYGMLRTGELLTLTRKNFSSGGNQRKILIGLGLTKAGKRAGAAESVVLGFDLAVNAIQQWMRCTSLNDPLTSSAPKWRSLFNQALVALKITSFAFRPYSLRRGGATWWYNKHHSFDRLLTDGRWQAAKTARIYLNDGLAMLAKIRIPQSDPFVSPYLEVFQAKLVRPCFATLEPLSNNRRTGGRGKGAKPKNSRTKKRSS